MARGGRAEITVDYRKLTRGLEVALRRVDRGTKKATIAACEEIKAMSLAEVPRASSTLANSFYYEVRRNGYAFEAEIGYGGNGDPTNPKTGEAASAYMVEVHEDLAAVHKNGKAKFLEDPVRRYQATKLKPGMAAAIRAELS